MAKRSLAKSHVSAQKEEDETESSQQTVSPSDSIKAKPVNRPCDMCRKRKSRCVFEDGKKDCILCRLRNQTCTFNAGPLPKRKKSSGPPIFESMTAEPSPTDKNISDYSEIKGYSLLKKTLGLQFPRCSALLGPTSSFEPKVLEHVKFDSLDEVEISPSVKFRRVAPSTVFIMEKDQYLDGYQELLQDCDAIERIVAPHGAALVDLYFRIIHPNYPILHREVFLEKYTRSYREFSPSLLAAVYMLALNWWDYDTTLAALPKPDVRALDSIALRTFSFVVQSPKLSTVQAGLLLLQRVRSGTSGNWALLSQVVAIAEELGLHLDCNNWKIPKWERGLRRRLAWAVWAEDKWGSLITGHSSRIGDSDWLVKKVQATDFREKTGPEEIRKTESADLETGRLLFKEFVGLSEIVGDIHDIFFSLKSLTTLVDVDSVLNAAEPVQARLRQWYKSLPECLHMNYEQSRMFSSTGYLHLAYFAAEIMLHRRIIQSLTALSPPDLVLACRNAARARVVAAIEFTKSLRKEHLEAFWHAQAAQHFALIGTFATLLMVTSSSTDEVEAYAVLVGEFRWALQISCRGFAPMEFALGRVNLMVSCLPTELRDRILQGGGSGHGPYTMHPESMRSDNSHDDDQDNNEDDEDDDDNSSDSSGDREAGNEDERQRHPAQLLRMNERNDKDSKYPAISMMNEPMNGLLIPYQNLNDNINYVETPSPGMDVYPSLHGSPILNEFPQHMPEEMASGSAHR
ncbi:hypothetical protein CANCADRAFT_33054 [Tortispora caseinolytica NRRL Y-17796]|uniref:Zn(2)-C6 fungal-type domain-containing protein n=1 Tax=Tortispora caseinolytica NRRL Y-17796 TaxID=767744 RepID=A0A1E4T9Q7_9ASCO|nr:hypothetical protein CANCADRAFT_33054 [Tortispora caseinolytica NRRL Y-17796]